MFRHVAPHRWADAFAGKLADDEITALDRHAEACERCRRTRDRVQRASSSFPALRALRPPELGWDAIHASVRARVHWSQSTAQREREKRPRRIPLGAIGGFAAAGGVLAAAALIAASGRRVAPAPVPAARTALHASAAPAAAANRAEQAAIVSRLAGEVRIDGRAPDFAHPLAAGDVIATGAGRLDAQFGEASAFAVGPDSRLELRRLDASVIELAIDGTVDVVVSARGKDQRFLVDAGDRVVEVRGTRFQVHHGADGTAIACQHGLVAVHDARGELAIGAAQKAIVPAGHTVAETRAVALSADELGELARTTPWATPGWTPDLAARTAPLEIAGPAARLLRVDGVELGAAPFAVRVAPGRHTVEVADAAGRFERAGWVDVGTAPARFAAHVTDDAPPQDTARARIAQLHAGVAHARAACTRAIARQGLTGAYVQIEVAISSSGAVGYLNVLDTDLPESAATCVRDALAAVPFGAGPAASWHERIEL